jgi:cell division protein FtsB
MDKTDEFVINQIKGIAGNSSLLKEKFKTDILNKKSLKTGELLKSKDKLERRIKTLDTQIDTTINSISKVEVNNMLNKIDNRIYRSMIKSLNEELESLEDNRKISIKEIDDLDSRKDWIDWVSKYGDEISDNLDKNTSDTLKGLVKDIIVHPVMGLNRDGINKQLGHKLNITFKLPIVNDKLIWNNKIDKISGYTIENGQSTYETENIPINIGGRPKKKV